MGSISGVPVERAAQRARRGGAEADTSDLPEAMPGWGGSVATD